MLVLLLTTAAQATTCATPQVLDALTGHGDAPHAFALSAPGRLDGVTRLPPPGGGKVVYGTPYDDHFETDNFTVNWWQAGISRDDAEAAADALETAWASYVDAGWTQPVSSDRYFLWILIDRGLGGTTGYTTEYFSDEFPDGYPVIYLNPDYAWDDAFWASLAAHELMHAFQYAVRDYDNSGGGEAETWYWEASATWASELADPGVDGHQYTSQWWADTAELTYTSAASTRQYGLFVFNAWLDIEGLGAGTMQSVWDLSQDRPSAVWDEIMAEATGLDAPDLWAGFTGAYVNDQLDESTLYSDIAPVGVVGEGEGGTLPYLGTHAWRVIEDATVTVDGDVVLGSAWERGDEVQVRAGEQLSVSGAVDGNSAYVLHTGPPGEVDTGDPGTAGDGGTTDGGATDGGATDGGGSDGGGVPYGSPRDPAGCGCGGGAPLAAAWLLPLLALVRRRQS